jgi:hypothetical protein
VATVAIAIHIMKELQDIVAAFEQVESGSTTAALATLVKASGSTY